MNYISILSTVVTLIFAVAVFRRYALRKGVHLLLWGIGLVFYGLGTLTEVILTFTFSELGLRVWYICGAMLTAAWLGQGTIHLLVRKRGIALSLTGLLIVLTLISVALVFSAPITAAAANFNVQVPVSAQYKEILIRSGLITFLTIILNIYGTLALVGGAVYSAFLFWRKKVLLNRMVGNILIAIGAMMPAMAGTFVKAGLVDWLYVSEFLGAVIMYTGFIQATIYRPVNQPTPASSTLAD